MSSSQTRITGEPQSVGSPSYLDFLLILQVYKTTSLLLNIEEIGLDKN